MRFTGPEFQSLLSLLFSIEFLVFISGIIGLYYNFRLLKLEKKHLSFGEIRLKDLILYYFRGESLLPKEISCGVFKTSINMPLNGRNMNPDEKIDLFIAMKEMEKACKKELDTAIVSYRDKQIKIDRQKIEKDINELVLDFLDFCSIHATDRESIPGNRSYCPKCRVKPVCGHMAGENN